MTGLAYDVLIALRIFGPCSNYDVARRLKLAPRRTYLALYDLVAAGLAIHPARQRWDISPKGRRWFVRQIQ